MKLRHEDELKKETILDVARKMMIAARTAPKGRGADNIVMALVQHDEVVTISRTMKEMVKEGHLPKYFLRDAENILLAPVMMLIGTKIKSLGLKPCGMCGFEDCKEKEKHPDHPCTFNTVDLGIAVGSAVGIAMDNRVDNRIMYTVGQAIIRMGILGNDVKIIYGIPLSVSSKNPFFDRKG
jgi:uncharacterized ferredoxin-like protein